MTAPVRGASAAQQLALDLGHEQRPGGDAGGAVEDGQAAKRLASSA